MNEKELDSFKKLLTAYLQQRGFVELLRMVQEISEGEVDCWYSYYKDAIEIICKLEGTLNP